MNTTSKTLSASRQSATKKLALSLLAASGLALASIPAQAGVSYIASGTNAETRHAGQSAEADISLVGNILTLTLINTTGVTTDQGDALTGILFDIAGSARLSLQSIALGPIYPYSPANPTDTSDLWVSGSKYDDTKSLAGSWTDSLAEHPRLAASYGLATTGFNGEFGGDSFEEGNSSPNYGIVGGKTLPGKINGSQYPFVEDSLTFKMKVTGTLKESDISDVRFLWGTSGSGWLQGSAVPVGDGNPGDGGHVPEPAGFALLGIAAGAARLARRRAA
ncbi:MAG: PEP-CTERM sorting domain-containing protein [Rhodocyclaceae bacterium]|nr:PEP-CTERM sorting domain-containing protein [Rhodocyclaceae bacterium]